ncbi:hypothetical protein [Actinoalloteichus sp. GBA129-24]|uniref:hypothetical protein n=1 Tax=Actinoalloteichus sp. GBA129-24 TaxID=1612551 RepID=UPI0009509A49|nr:hypothetical protein [Actinoalloteichus sp. GBA129-24]APU18599.1 hypothetical protein UA75_02800 [Actinoalloteichus sp. GBA129-24]
MTTVGLHVAAERALDRLRAEVALHATRLTAAVRAQRYESAAVDAERIARLYELLARWWMLIYPSLYDEKRLLGLAALGAGSEERISAEAYRKIAETYRQLAERVAGVHRSDLAVG